jgi:peptide/nickel transport system substrate-binding protein
MTSDESLVWKSRFSLTRRDVNSLAGVMLWPFSNACAQETQKPADPSSSIAHALAMHGEPALPADFKALPYVNPNAPKGGRLILGLQGTFDSLNPYVVKGVAPDAMAKFVWQPLMMRSLDEPFSLYGLLASRVQMPPDRSYIAFELHENARFSDGKPVTVQDVAHSYELLKAKGKPFYRTAYSKIAKVSVEGRRIRFDMKTTEDRELPLLMATMPIFAKHATPLETFEETTFTPPIGSGPYRVEEVKAGERIRLVRDVNFWAKDVPVVRGLYNFDEIRYDFYRDSNTLFEAFKSGLYDLRLENDPSRWRTGYDIPAVREGRITVADVPNRLPKGMNALVFNTRRGLFSLLKVREALSLMFDFSWVNRNLYSQAYQPTRSYFEGSDLSSIGQAPSAQERELLAPYLKEIRAEILEGSWSPYQPDGTGRDRDQARLSLALLQEAGYTLLEGELVHTQTRAPFTFEIMVTSRGQERLALNYASALTRIGVTARVRMVDDVQFWRRLSTFDYDMLPYNWTGTPSPGAEQWNRWGAQSADRQGSLNYAGAKSAAIDACISAMLAAQTREPFVAATRALDRVLLSGFYVIPLFHAAGQWLAMSAKLKRPMSTPLFGVNVETLWSEA